MSDPAPVDERTGSRPESGKPTKAQQGLAPAEPKPPPARTDPAKQPPQPSGTPEGLANYLIEYLSSGERPSYKVVLQAILIARRQHGLGTLAHVLIEKKQEEFGNFLNLTFIVLHADGSKEIADLVAAMFGEQQVYVIPGQASEGAWKPLKGAGSPDAPGLSAVLTYQGRTFVELGGEGFYISGVPPPGTWTPKTGSTSVLFISKASNPKKMYRLDFDVLKEGPNAGRQGWEHNQKGVAKILKLSVTNHQPAGGWGRVAGWACRAYKWGGRALWDPLESTCRHASLSIL